MEAIGPEWPSDPYGFFCSPSRINLVDLCSTGYWQRRVVRGAGSGVAWQFYCTRGQAGLEAVSCWLLSTFQPVGRCRQSLGQGLSPEYRWH